MDRREKPPSELVAALENLASAVPNGAKEVVALARTLLERDRYTSEHCNRACALSLELGRAAALPQATLARLALAAQLHDIGKISIPDRVLLKPGRLEQSELVLMRRHPQSGYDMFMASHDETLTEVAEAVLRHHEGFDGNGYPGRLKGEAIPVLSRIIAIADSYDALATDRPYRRAMAHQSIMRLLFEDNLCKYDPHLVATFASVIETSRHRSDAEPEPPR